MQIYQRRSGILEKLVIQKQFIGLTIFTDKILGDWQKPIPDLPRKSCTKPKKQSVFLSFDLMRTIKNRSNHVKS